MKNIILTGAGSGIGEATARMLNMQGHNLLLIGRNKERLEKLRQQLGSRVEYALCDVRDHAEVNAVFNAFLISGKKLDVLINNAGVGYFDPLTNGRVEHWHEMVDTNVKGLLHCIHAALPHLLAAKGLLINMGSVGSHQVFPNSGVYCATKHAVLAISESLRLEFPDRLRVTTISPGSVNTPFIDKTTNPEMQAQYKDYFAGGLDAEVVAQQVVHAINTDPRTIVSEIIIRPFRDVK